MLKLSRNKTSSKAAGDGGMLPAWRPDFRDATALPDLKTVRTSFFLNISSMAVALSMLLYTAHREWTAASLKRATVDTEARAADAQAASKKAVADYALFVAEQKKFEELQKLAGSSFRLTDFLMHLGATLPDDIKLTRVELPASGATLLIGGSVKGLDIIANAAVSDYEKALRADALLAEQFSGVVLTNVTREQVKERLVFEIVFTFKKPATKTATGGAK